MKWLLTFLAGVLVGAGGLFAFLRQVPHDAAPDAAPMASAPAAATPAPDAPIPASAIAGKLPPAPHIAPDFTELADIDLPLRPAVADLAALPGGAVPPPALPPGTLSTPVEGIAAGQIRDTFDQPRGNERHHEALDIMAPKGTKVVAAADGVVAKLFISKPGGITLYQFDPSEKYAYYYAHLDRYADGVKEGAMLKRGDPIGYVGTTGNADPKAPHLHFAVFELTPEKLWWKGTPVNPYPLLGSK